MKQIDWTTLREAAADAAANSYSPYSGLGVGAAAMMRDGRILSATNVENASFVAGICAEAALVGVIVSAGCRRGDITAVAVTDGAGAELAPCGSCRQLLHEMGGAGLLVNARPMSELLPDAFGPEDLT